MSNFFRRAIAFILGMVFTVVVTVGAVAGSLYWAFKNLSLSQLGVEQDVLGDLNGFTIEEWVALVSDVNSSGNVTFEALEKYGLDADNLITSMGVNPELADKEDVDMIKKISITNLAGANALNEIKMGVLFAFLPKSAETNTYPLFSKSARSTLRNYSLAEMTAVDNYTGKAKIWTIIGDMKFASIYSQPFEETYNEVEKKYEYTSNNYSLDLIGNLDFSVVANPLVHGQAFDIGKELNEGSLKEIGSEKINEFIASFIPDAETSEVVKNYLSVLSVAVKDLFFFNEVENAYQFDYTILLEELTVGKLIGANYDEENDVWLDAEGEPIVADNLEGEIMLGLYGLNINDVIDGFMSGEILSTIMQGSYFGSALGNKKSQIAPAGYCSASCSIEYEADGITEHRHNYYWVDGEGYFVGEMFNLISNKKISDALTGDLDLIGDISSIKIGEILGYQLCANGDGCVVHENSASCDGFWYNGSTSVSKDDSMSKILYNIYSYSLNDIKNGDMTINGIVKGILLGDLLLYTRINNPNGEGGDYCDVDCADNHSHKYYWIDSQNNHLEALDEELANISLEELVSGEFDVSGVVGDMLVGELMGYTQVDGVDGYCNIDCSTGHEHEYYFIDSSNNQITGVNAILASLAISDLTSGDVDFIALLGDMYVGELMGFEKVEKQGYCSPNCENIEEGHSHNYFWKDGNAEISKLNNSLANIELQKLIDGDVSFIDFVGDMYVGDMLENYKKCLGDTNCTLHQNCSSVAGWYELVSENNYQKVSVLDETIANIKLSELINGDTNFKDVVGTLLIGDVLGYKYCSGDSSCAIHENCSNEKGWYSLNEDVYEKVSKLNQTIANHTLGDIMGGMDFATIVGDLYVGDVMNYHIAEENEVPDNVDLTDYCVKGCETEHERHHYYWVDENKNHMLEVESIVANFKLSELMSGHVDITTEIKTLRFNDIISVENDSPMILKSLKYVKIGEMTEKMNTLTLGECIDMNDAPSILKVLSETSINDLGTEMKKLYIGDVMGYEYCSGNQDCTLHSNCNNQKGWYKNGFLITGINAKLAGKTLEQVETSGFDTSEFVLGDVMEVDENGMFGLIYKGEYNSDGTMKEGDDVYNSAEEIPVSDIAERMSDGVKSASVAQLEESDIISLSDDAKTKLDKLFAINNGLGTDYDSARELWSALTLDNLLNEIINSLPG